MLNNITVDDEGYYDDTEEIDDESYDALSESLDDDQSSEFFGAFLPAPLQFLDPVGAAIGAATGAGRSRRGGRRGVPTATGGGFYQRPLAQQLVTQAQLRSSLARVQADVKKNSVAITKVATQTTSNHSRLNQQNQINVKQGRQISRIRKDMEQQAQTQMLLSLINRTEDLKLVTFPTTYPGTALKAGDTITVEKELDLLTLLLGFGGFGGGGGGLSNPLTLFAISQMGK